MIQANSVNTFRKPTSISVLGSAALSICSCELRDSSEKKWPRTETESMLNIHTDVAMMYSRKSLKRTKPKMSTKKVRDIATRDVPHRTWRTLGLPGCPWFHWDQWKSTPWVCNDNKHQVTEHEGSPCQLETRGLQLTHSKTWIKSKHGRPLHQVEVWPISSHTCTASVL